MFKTIMISVYGVKLNFTSNSHFFMKELMADYKYFHPKFGRFPDSDANIFFQVLSDLDYIPFNYPDFDETKLVKQIVIENNSTFRIRILSDEWIFTDISPKEIVFVVNPSHGICCGYSTKENLSIYHMLSDAIMNILTENLIERKICCIHAAAISKNNSGIIFPGKSGCGKTTLSIILTKAGYKFLSDDYPFILSRNSCFEVLAFPQRLKVRQDILNQHLEFYKHAEERAIHDARPYIDITQVYTDCLERQAKLKFIAFPILTSKSTSFKRISKEEALQKILPCIYDPFPYIQKDTSIRKAIFKVAYNLVSISKCYNLFIGKEDNLLKNAVDAIFNQND